MATVRLGPDRPSERPATPTDLQPRQTGQPRQTTTGQARQNGATSETIAVVTQLFTGRLRQRTSTSGALPLITYYDETSGERIELSAISFSNWVDKTAGLIVDELLLDAGTPVLLTLARTHPAHWVTLVWVAASWRAGCPVTTAVDRVGGDDPPGVEVVGPGNAFDDHEGSIERIACSLHPFGLGFTDPLPSGVIDYGVEVRAQPDSFAGPAPVPADTAWIDDQRRLTHADVVDDGRANRAERTMIIPAAKSDPWTLIAEASIKPVLTGGSAVIVLGADDGRRRAIADAERVTRVAVPD